MNDYRALSAAIVLLVAAFLVPALLLGAAVEGLRAFLRRMGGG